VVGGKTTFKEEFVTTGGTGGFNFQHTWSSGYLAAKAMADSPLH